MDIRHKGRLKKWNAARGFGFIVAEDGGAELFVHVSAFPRSGPPPTEGELLSFEVEPDRDGKRRAVRVGRPGDQASGARSSPRSFHVSKRRKEGSNFFAKFIGFAIVCALVAYGYNAYSTRAAKFGSSLPTPSAILSPAKLPVPSGFHCDGRSMCSQMTSCREATLFLQNCPGMQMDGNRDGVPCEQQWCTSGH